MFLIVIFFIWSAYFGTKEMQDSERSFFVKCFFIFIYLTFFNRTVSLLKACKVPRKLFSPVQKMSVSVQQWSPYCFIASHTASGDPSLPHQDRAVCFMSPAEGRSNLSEELSLVINLYVALHEMTWCMFVWCTQNALRRQQFHVAPAMPAL